MNPTDKTRAALLTPPAPGAIAVIAVCGPDAETIAAGALRTRRRDDPPRLIESRPTLCRIVDHDGVVDDAVAVRLVRDGIPVVEISTHGGVRIVQRTLALLERRGAALVRADELPVHWSADPIERDVDRALLRTPSRRMAEWLLSQRAILPPFLRRLDQLSDVERAAFERRSAVGRRLVRGLHVAIVGPPNVGKSTLANRLIGRDRVITSDAPGTTRDWVDETALIGGWPVTLTDTAGVRETACEIETEAIQRGIGRAAAADLALVVLHATADAGTRDRQRDEIITRIRLMSPHVVVHNKRDLLSPDRCGDAVRADGAPGCLISAVTGDGIEALETEMIRALGLDLLDDGVPTGFEDQHITPGAGC